MLLLTRSQRELTAEKKKLCCGKNNKSDLRSCVARSPKFGSRMAGGSNLLNSFPC